MTNDGCRDYCYILRIKTYFLRAFILSRRTSSELTVLRSCWITLTVTIPVGSSH